MFFVYFFIFTNVLNIIFKYLYKLHQLECTVENSGKKRKEKEKHGDEFVSNKWPKVTMDDNIVYPLSYSNIIFQPFVIYIYITYNYNLLKNTHNN